MSGRSWPFWVFIGLLVVAHFVLHLALGIGRAAPDLLTVAVLFGARRVGAAAAAGLGLALGLLQDALSLTLFGASALTYSIVGFAGSRSRDLFIGDSLLFVGVYLFVGKWLSDVIYFLLGGSAGRGGAVTALLVEAPIAALYSAAAGTLALVAYRAITGER